MERAAGIVALRSDRRNTDHRTRNRAALRALTMSSDDRHKQKMAHRKAVQDAEVAWKTIIEKGLLIVHTGPGKGKSTAAFGLVLRAPGHGWQVSAVHIVKC